MKHYFTIILLVFSVSVGTAQSVSLPKEKVANPWRFGGNFGLNFGGNSTHIQIAPALGYMLTPKMEVGGSVGYTYHKYNDTKANIFSTGIFSNYQVIPQAFARINYEHHMGKQKFQNSSNSFSENSLWVGAGYRSLGRVGFQAGIMYNVLHNKDNSIYNSPWRPFAGVSFNF
ncbi:MAG: hypothetical protein KGV44_11815 [Flavobacteriaceae bacterium]|nr:hypothetical protein [Flavobacteriaceae bacterium]